MTTIANIPRVCVEFGPGTAHADEADMQVDRADVVDALTKSLVARGCGELFARMCAEAETARSGASA